VKTRPTEGRLPEGIVLVPVALGTMLAPLNSTMIAVALPELLEDFGRSLAWGSWIVTSYLVAMAAVQPLGGSLGDRYGRRRLFLIGLTLFLAATVIAALSWSIEVLIAARSVDYIHATLQMSLSQAVRDDLIPRNVAAGERPRSSRNRQEAKALSPTQVKTLLKTARGTRNEALYVVAVHTGLRQGELLGLKWTDVDLHAGKLSVRRSLKVTESGLDFGPPKNQASRRSVPLNKTAVATLRAHRLRQN
jgi:integrase